MLNRVKSNTYLNTGLNGSAAQPWTIAPAVPYSVKVGGVDATEYGNSGIGIVRGPGNDNWDMTLSKETRVGGLHEDGMLVFRTEFFNVWNHPQYANPSTTVGAASYSQITASAVAPRLIQFALKYQF